MLGEPFGIVGWDAANGGEIGLDAGLFKAGLDEVLGGAYEDAGAAADGGAEGAEVAAGFRCEEEDDLLGFGGDGDGDALFADFLFQVWISKNQLSGGGFVVPRRKAATRR